MGVYPESFLAPMREDIAALDARIARAAPEGDCASCKHWRGAKRCHAEANMQRRGSALMDFAASLALIAPEILLLGFGPRAAAGRRLGGRQGERADQHCCAVVLGAWFLLVAPSLCAGASGPDTVAFGGQFSADAFAGFAKLLIFAAAACVAGHRAAVLRPVGAMRAEYPVLILFAALGMAIMVSATDLLTLYIGLELNSLAAYVLAAFLRR